MTAPRKPPRTHAAPVAWPTGGYFTAPVRAWFGPHWQPQSKWGKDEVAHRQAAVRGRNVQLAAGYTGTIAGLSTAADAIAKAFVEKAKANSAKWKAGK